MDKTKAAMERYPRWQPLNQYVERIELTVDSDFPACVGNAKCLLEAVGKEICVWQEVELTPNSKLAGVIKTAFKALGIKGDDHLVQISTSLASIAQRIGKLRNDIDTNAHGKPLAELEQTKADTAHSYTAEFLLGSADLISSFLIETFEQFRLQKEIEEAEEPEPEYEDFEDFTAAFDEQYGEVFIGDYSYQPSEVLFRLDPQAFNTEHGLYRIRLDVSEDKQ